MSRTALLSLILILMLNAAWSGLWTSTMAADENADAVEKKADAERGTTTPADFPLSAKLSVGKDNYTLDPAQQGEAFRKSLENDHTKKPEPPAVDIKLDLFNTGKQDLVIMVEGDQSLLDLKLVGKGAVTVTYRQAFTREFRLGRQVTIAAGKSYSIQIKNLAHGMRGMANASYWTEPGEYKLSASYTTMSPNARGEEKKIEVTTAPVKLMVEAKK